MAGSTNFPTSLDDHVGGDPFGFAVATDGLGTLLTATANIGATSLTVTSTTGFESRGELILSESTGAVVPEVVTYTGKDATHFTGVSALTKAWAIGDRVRIGPTARSHNDLAAAIVAIETKLGAGAEIAVNKLADGAALEHIRTDAAGTGVEWGPPPLVKLAESVLSGTAASIDFTSIPATYRHLLLICHGRGDNASVAVNTTVTFNGDTGSNYDLQMVNGIAAAASAAELFGQTGLAISSFPAASASAGRAGSAVIFFPHYANATLAKTAIVLMGYITGTTTGTGVVTLRIGVWRTSNAAINQITLTLSAGNYIAGSCFTLYGWPA